MMPADQLKINKHMERSISQLILVWGVGPVLFLEEVKIWEVFL